MSGPYKIIEDNIGGATEYIVTGPNGAYFRTINKTNADNAFDALKEAYAAGRADADKGLREACETLVTSYNEQDGEEGDARYYPEDIQKARAALAATEPEGANP